MLTQVTANHIRSRSRLLTQCCGHLPLALAIRALKLPVYEAQRLTQKAPPPLWTAGSPLMDLPALAQHLNDQGEYISGFAALHEAPGHWLSPDKFKERLHRARLSSPPGLVTRLGTRRNACYSGRSWKLWDQGEPERALDVLSGYYHHNGAGQRQSDERMQVHVVGVDLVDEPSTNYQQWLMAERALRLEHTGRDYRRLARAKTTFLNVDLSRPLRDVVVVCRRVAFELHHDSATGVLKTVKRVDDARLAGLIADQIMDLFAWADPPADPAPSTGPDALNTTTCTLQDPCRRTWSSLRASGSG